MCACVYFYICICAAGAPGQAAVLTMHIEFAEANFSQLNSRERKRERKVEREGDRAREGEKESCSLPGNSFWQLNARVRVHFLKTCSEEKRDKKGDRGR